MQKWGACHFFTTLQFSSITFTVCVGKVRFPFGSLNLQSFELAMQGFHPHSRPSLVLKPCIIFLFLIHSGSLQKKLTPLFNLNWNTQKSKWTVFLSARARRFLVLKRFQKRSQLVQGFIPLPFIYVNPPFSKIPPFLEIQDAPNFYRPIRKTKVLNKSFNWLLCKFYPQSVLILEEHLLKW